MQEIIVTERFTFFRSDVLPECFADVPKDPGLYLMMTAWRSRPDFRASWLVHIGNDEDLKRYVDHHLWEDLDNMIELTSVQILRMVSVFRSIFTGEHTL